MMIKIGEAIFLSLLKKSEGKVHRTTFLEGQCCWISLEEKLSRLLPSISKNSREAVGNRYRIGFLIGQGNREKARTIIKVEFCQQSSERNFETNFKVFRGRRHSLWSISPLTFLQKEREGTSKSESEKKRNISQLSHGKSC